MASACYYALFTCFLIIISRIGDANGYTNALDSEIARKHELWMAEHGRVYKDEAEKARRFEIFKENVEYIEDFNNAGKHRYTLGVNLFADLTSEEFLATYASGFKKPEPEIEESLRGGIFHGSCGTAVNHAVTVIGYGESSKDKYWIVKNSWSSKWGENGYIRMEKDVPSPSGMCGITEWAVYPTM
ncbi:uncharacterized protein A4U43_C01F25500 [Asparagus officinalis]|uniref:Cathepsin propeptide inhibitor domain-containing protein n=1 Tax=Asparagus officinalis TaxID=4686 RepID=A0A5P1FSB9_ASPOF|nr:uncharacterized protein A4U43_C01F25500 [Asparagus officinalis]